MPKKGKGKKVRGRQSLDPEVWQRGRDGVLIRRGSRGWQEPPRAQQSRDSSAASRLVEAGVSIAKKIPVISDVVNTVESVASSVLGFLGLGSSSFQVHYDVAGRRQLRTHPHLLQQGLKLSDVAGAADPGSILLKYTVSIGPQGSRSRIMGQLFEMVKYNQVQLEVLPNCAATEPGQLAYVFVPDVSDTSLEAMTNEERVASVLSRESVKLAQLWQGTVLTFPVPQRQYYVRVEDVVERLSSPGVIYVIAITQINTAMLPTLRQTSRLTFSRATLIPEVNSTEVGFLKVLSSLDEVETKTVPSDLSEAVGFSASFAANRVVRMHMRATFTTMPVSADYTGDVNVTCLKLKKGERLSLVGTGEQVITRFKIIPVSSCSGDNLLNAYGVVLTPGPNILADYTSQNRSAYCSADVDSFVYWDSNGTVTEQPHLYTIVIEPVRLELPGSLEAKEVKRAGRSAVVAVALPEHKRVDADITEAGSWTDCASDSATVPTPQTVHRNAVGVSVQNIETMSCSGQSKVASQLSRR